MIRLGAACGLGAMIQGSGVSRPPQTLASETSAVASGEAPLKTRMFWTWDHSTEWAVNRAGAQTIGACNDYGRTTDAFLGDYTRLLRWCGRHSIDAVVVWGLLRDCHGGLESVKRLCEVAAQEGVRLLCGVGLNAYGGVYYEGNSPYNLERHLQAHPELSAIDADGNPMSYTIDANGTKTSLNTLGTLGPRGFYHACPSRRENQDFVAESLTWLFKNAPLGGVQMESGDTGVCQCPQCRARRQHPVSGFSWEDMALMYPLATAAIRAVAPEAWIVCETYSHPQPYQGPEAAPQFGQGKPAWADAALAQFPRGVFVQWVADNFVDSFINRDPAAPVWTAEGRVSGDSLRHIMRAHYGTYWYGGFRGELAIDWIAKMTRQSMAAGFDGISLFGEVPPSYASAELNYLALADYGSAGNPKADLDVFLQRVAAPLLGSAEYAQEFLRFARLRDDRAQIPAALATIYSRLASLPPDAARRWCCLANYLALLAPSES